MQNEKILKNMSRKQTKKRRCFISNTQTIKAKKQAGINQRCHLSITMWEKLKEKLQHDKASKEE